MRRALAALALLPLPALALAQEVVPCDPAPAVTALIEPWEETTAALAGGAVRLAVIEGEEGSRRLLVLTLPPAPPAAEGAPEGTEAVSDPTAPAPERRCRIVIGAGLGFADLDLAARAFEEDASAGTLRLRLPALGFLPESTELVPETLVLTFTVADDGLAAAVEGEPGAAGEAGGDASADPSAEEAP